MDNLWQEMDESAPDHTANALPAGLVLIAPSHAHGPLDEPATLRSDQADSLVDGSAQLEDLPVNFNVLHVLHAGDLGERANLSIPLNPAV